MDIALQSARFCELVAKRPDITNATARIGAWLFGVAREQGKFPVELTLRQIRDGVEIDDRTIPGTGCRNETIRASLGWLEEEGVLTALDGRPSAAGHTYRQYSFNL